MIARLVGAYLIVFAIVLLALSIGAYLFVGAQYHSLLLPALSTPEGASGYSHAMQRVALTIIAFDIPLLIVVGIASTLLARISVRPLLRAQERERAFVADAAHELRSPLATIASVAQAARNNASDAPLREALDLIAATALDASALIADLLTLARSPSSALLHREPVDLGAIVAACVNEFRSRAAAVSITLDAHTGSAIVNGDARRLRELVRNLIENALRHARSRITVTCEVHDATASLRVSDDGLGVDPQERERIFERFFRGKDSSGSGLGLAIAQWVARAHDGSIALEERSPGAAFTASIPLFDSSD